jgi:hypothetical protein
MRFASIAPYQLPEMELQFVTPDILWHKLGIKA